MKKYSNLIFVIFFLLVLIFTNFDNYLDFYKNVQQFDKDLEIVQKDVKNFSISNIKKYKDINFYYTPYNKFIDNLSDKISNANDKVFIEIYMFTENDRFRKALLKAKNNGAKIKIILEKNPYKSPGINNKAYNFLKNNNIDVVWSNAKNYSLNHTKLYLIDNEVVISTGNLTYSTFNFNRDFFVFIKDKMLFKKLELIFNNDFKGNKFIIYDNNLVLSPFYAREKLEKLFKSAKKSIKMYFQYLKYDELEKVLIEKSKEDVKIQIVVSKDFYKNNKEKIKYLKKKGLEIKFLNKHKMHAKAILVDNNVLFIGSQNFSKYSLEKNRELGIILNNKEIILKFLKIFNKDFTGK